MREQYFLNWDEAFNSTAAQVGGKGHNLPGCTGMVFQYQ